MESLIYKVENYGEKLSVFSLKIVFLFLTKEELLGQ